MNNYDYNVTQLKMAEPISDPWSVGLFTSLAATAPNV